MIRIGTRGSRLALAQTELVEAAWKQRYPEDEIEIVVLRTEGDRILDRKLIEFGGKGVFVAEFEQALQEGRIDLAVHSAKDMPMELENGLVIAGVLPREDARDVLVLRKNTDPDAGVRLIGRFEKAETETPAYVIGTGSLRRQFQMSGLYRNIEFLNIRGNVPTRLEKIRNGECDGVVLAAAGLARLGLFAEEDFIYHRLPCEKMVPAGGQGIIAVEGRQNDPITEKMQQLSDVETMLELDTERWILRQLQAGCHEPVGVYAQTMGDSIRICGIRSTAERVIRMEETGTLADREWLMDKLIEGMRID